MLINTIFVINKTRHPEIRVKARSVGLLKKLNYRTILFNLTHPTDYPNLKFKYMDSFIPAPDSIPIHWLWFQVLLLVTFVLHLILMNLVLGGTLIALWDNFIKGKRTDYAASLPVLIALAINLGVPPLLFVQVLFGHLFYSASVTLAVPWILIIPLLILAYYGSYVYVKNREKAPAWSGAGLILSALFILYTGFMYVNNSTLTLNPGAMAAHLENPGGMNLNMDDNSLWPRYLHFIIAAIAIASVGIAIYAHYTYKDDPAQRQEVIRINLRRFAWFTLAQFIFGTLFWLTTPKHVYMYFMGQNIAATVLMILSWLIIASMILLAFRGRLWPVVLHAALVIIIMAVMRELMRAAYLADTFKPSQLEVMNKYSPFILFLAIFLAGIYMIYYMIRLATDKNNKS